MKLIKLGSKGSAVKKWQYFLIGQGFEPGIADGDFGPNTHQATIDFQTFYSLEPDGVVGNKTYGQAMLLGFSSVDDDRPGKEGADWPPKPDFKYISSSEREELFGKFSYKHEPQPGNPEHIAVLDDWATKNLVKLEIPQLTPIKGSPTVWWHKKGADQMVQLWQRWEDEGLIHHVLTWAGSYVPRLVRGSSRTLSNHAFGTAFDINVTWNWLGAQPALVGQKGSVRELVPVANELGFFWGGHYNNRLDGMHFEIAKIV